MMLKTFSLLVITASFAMAVPVEPTSTSDADASTITPAPTMTTSLPAGCFVDEVNQLTRCEAETPVCTTIYDHGTVSAVQCVLKRAAAPEPTIEAREADPMYCVVDAQGTRCMPDRRAAEATPPPAVVEKREPEPQEGCFVDENGLERCESTEPVCTTYVGDDGQDYTACVL